MHEVVVMAVRKAVRAATTTFTAISMIRFFIIVNYQLYKFRMSGVISSYRELTGFEPVELADKCSAAEVMSVRSTFGRLQGKNFSSQQLVRSTYGRLQGKNFCGRRPLTPVNSQQASLRKL